MIVMCQFDITVYTKLFPFLPSQNTASYCSSSFSEPVASDRENMHMLSNPDILTTVYYFEYNLRKNIKVQKKTSISSVDLQKTSQSKYRYKICKNIKLKSFKFT